MTFTPDQITGTLIHYYVTCKREAWLYAHRVMPDEYDENIMMGRALAEIKESQLQDFPFANLHFDKIGKQRGHYLVTEHKKTLKNPEGAKMQLLFYMYQLKTGLKLREINGKVISGKTVLYVEGNGENMRRMEALLDEVASFVTQPKAPEAEPIAFCRKCGYRDYCY